MNKQALIRASAFATVAVLGLSLSSSVVVLADSKADPVPWTGAVPKANCSAGDRIESGLQGQTTAKERFELKAGRSDSEDGYNCNLELVGQFQGEGAWSQKGPAYYGDCAYFGTDSNSLMRNRGVTVVDVSDPQNPRATAYLADTLSMLDPHETLKSNEQRALLAGSRRDGNDFAVYDLSGDCRHPVLTGNIPLAGSSAHMGGFAPDGLTYYVGQSNRGIGGLMAIVDLADPSKPRHLLNWQFLGDGRPHDVNLNKAGTRLYSGQPGTFGNTGSSIGPNGLVILDTSDVQSRLPNPQIRIVSKLFWEDGGQAEQMLPITIKGRPYIVSTDESGGAGGVGGLAAACARKTSPYGFAQLIDISDEKNPKIVSKLMLEVNTPERCGDLLKEPPGLVYNAERCDVDRPHNARVLACAYHNAGLRVFDIRDPYHPKEIAYYKPKAVRRAVLPGSGSWNVNNPDRTADRIAGLPRFRQVLPANQHAKELRGPQWEIWVTSDDNGFQVLRFTEAFRAGNKGLFD